MAFQYLALDATTCLPAPGIDPDFLTDEIPVGQYVPAVKIGDDYFTTTMAPIALDRPLVSAQPIHWA